jgi:O-antigen ligase
MSLNGRLVSVRGVEVKDLALQVSCALGLALTGVCLLRRRTAGGSLRMGAAGYAELLLAGWVALSLASSLWAGDARAALTQGLIYALNLGWAVAVAATLRRQHVAALLNVVLVISTVGAGLCVWYYYERNPYHRPGFPIGNPLTLAAAIVPGVLIAMGLVGQAAVQWRRKTPWRGLGGLAALVPLVWCLVLTQGRGALLGLGVGAVAMVLFLAGRRLRWVVATVFIVAVMVAGSWWLTVSHLDVAMARGATIRLRFYAWRYAAELWNQSARTRIAGLGAGDYPQLAGAHSTRDRALDPAAFAAELVEHAHNEFFEVLTEIGLVGGVTWVGGFVATFFAAAGLRRRALTAHERWMLAALLGGVAALLTDAMTGVALRLPGVPAVFYTLLGALWAVSGGSGEDERAKGAALWSAGYAPARILAGAVSLVAAVGAGWLAVDNWRGVQIEQRAWAAYKARDYDAARSGLSAAEQHLLDPVRVLIDRQAALDCGAALAHAACVACLTQTATAPGETDCPRAVRMEQQAFAEAVELSMAAPALIRTEKTAARCATWLAEVYRRGDPWRARYWSGQAERAWRRQRELTPFDVDTLLGLMSYSPSVEARIALLRDALRSLGTLAFEDEMQGRAYQFWLGKLAQVAQQPGFEQVLARFMNAAGPITPETDLDAVIASMAPETHRLVAAWDALRGEYAAAAEQAAQAAQLYRPLRARFPELEATALAEQAEYVLCGSPANAGEAVALVQQALVALPAIQTQKAEEMAAPFRRQLSFCLLAAGKVDEAVEVLRVTLGDEADDREAVERALDKLMQSAAAARLPAELTERIRGELCPRFPGVCGK